MAFTYKLRSQIAVWCVNYITIVISQIAVSWFFVFFFLGGGEYLIIKILLEIIFVKEMRIFLLEISRQGIICDRLRKHYWIEFQSMYKAEI